LRYRILDFLPLLLAILLAAGWFGLQQPIPLPDLGILRPAATEVATPTVKPAPPTAVVTRATAIEALCNAGQPRFLGSIAALKARLGNIMGDPAACERQVDAEGNTEQLTTTGLAYYRRRLNEAAFTTGWDHWALDGNDLLQWAGNEVEPPADAARGH
jgi:hypothetical protein